MPPRKRAASTTIDEPRRSRRISSNVKKSNYFEEDDDSEDPLTTSNVKKRKGKSAPASKRKQEVDDGLSDEYQDNAADQDEDEDGGEEEENDDDDGDEDEFATKVTVVKLETLRPDGGVEYADDFVHKNTMLFLKDLKENNERSWLKSNDREFRRAQQDWESFVMSFTSKLSGLDFTIPELPARDVVFRIYRDTRFSKDPTPYKQPGNCFVGGGLWHPENESIYKIRESIDERPRRWRRILNNAGLKKHFLPDASKSSSADVALKAFAARNKENAMKVGPKGIRADHRDLELFKLRNYVLSKKVADNVIFGPGSQEKLVDIFTPMVPFVSFLNSIVRPDPNVDGDFDSGDDEE
ncbi:hypothetical protein SAPIO_CDS8201 [Scedosporium apiospermum]|uniref:DUF2461 domain-containing protein n=1 Tax=Pseudallescheria apiosperma TaxID=563466 RepID=A0A084FZ41_PSEDA|nr:uncharacterized protein SAPIO_CDS8201 [Scedosporium apiospermum]KEZ40353.1 hypothetical protein SAPIO_CDS8201 [Scedosporium apiospermum]